MIPLLRRPTADLERLPISLDLRAVNLAEGVRAALAVAVLVAANEWVGWPPMMEAALGALLTCLSDAGGPVRRRVVPLLAFAGLGGLLTAGFGLVRAAGPAVAVPLACLGILLLSFARAWGQSQLQVGNLLTVVLVLALDHPLDGRGAAVLGAAFTGGSLWAVLLTAVIWQVHPDRPARRAVGEAWRALGALVADLRALVTAGAGMEAWEAHARAHRRAVRDAIEAARATVLDTLRGRDGASRRGQRALIRLEAAEQLFGALIALSDLLERNAAAEVRVAADRLLRLMRPVLRVLARAVAEDGTAAPDWLDRAITAMAAGLPPPLLPIGGAIVDRLRVAARLVVPEGWAVPAMEALPLRERVLAPLRANLTWRSAVLRHAVRAATVAAPALTITLLSGDAWAHWLTITLVLTMQPFFALTWQRAVERIAGTMLGGVLAAAIGLVCTTPVSTAAALFPLAVAAFAVRAVSFGAFIALMTPLVVLLAEIGRPDTSEWAIAGMRALYILIGGLLAVSGALLLWPSWEPDRLRRELRAAIAAHAAWAREGTDAARRAAGVGSNNLEASLARALQEPRPHVRPEVEAALVADASLRRIAGRLSALGVEGGWQRADTAPWRAWAGAALDALAAGRPVEAPRPQAAAPESVARLVRQVELLEGVLRRA